MARFSDLPCEMVAAIWEHVLAPEDLVSFARVCKKVYGQSLPSLGKHRELRDKYSTFGTERTTYSSDGSGRPLGPPVVRHPDQLKDILAHPRNGLYVQELRLERELTSLPLPLQPAASADSPHPQVQKFIAFPSSVEDREMCHNAMANAILQSGHQAWNAAPNGDEESIYALLLLAAPDIVNIEFKRSYGPQCLRRAMERLATTSKPGVPTPLRRLKSISVHGDDHQYVVFFDFVAFLASLPSLESISAEAMHTYGFDHDFSCLLPRTSNVKHLSFIRGTIDPANLDKLLQGVKALESFSYVQPWNGDRAWCPDDYPIFDPAATCTTLLAHARSSLTSLRLRATIEEGVPSYVCSRRLDEFDNLKQIEISLCLVANSETSVVVSDWPSSIESIGVRDIDLANLSQVGSIVSNITKTRVARVSRLETLALYIEGGVDADSLALFDTMRDQCESAGFTLRLLDEPGMD